MPDSTSETKLAQHIHHISQAFGTPVFAPHLTLARVPKQKEKKAYSELKRLGKTHSEIELKLNQVVCGEHPYQKVMVKINPSTELNTLYTHTISMLGGDASQIRNPHFSLLYGNYSCEELQPVLKTAHLSLPKVISIKRIALVRLNGLPWNWHIELIEKLKNT